jgi:hypothetical protein
MGEVEILSDEKSKVLAEQNGWSRAYADGYVAGETLRRQREERLPLFAMVGIDEWARGFRAGFFTRQNPDRSQVRVAGTPEMAQTHRRSNWMNTWIHLQAAYATNCKGVTNETNGCHAYPVAFFSW